MGGQPRNRRTREQEKKNKTKKPPFLPFSCWFLLNAVCSNLLARHIAD
jgi:hypothetical protein